MTDFRNTILVGDALAQLRSLPDESVHCVVTSPPYWGLRDYGVAGQIGLEASPEDFVARLVEVFGQVRRVLRADGTAWVNMGDCYAQDGGFGKQGKNGQCADREAAQPGGPRERRSSGRPPMGLKPKDLVGQPWRLAFALQADGWYLRSDIVWHKPNPMPESVLDRPTKSHEYLFLLSKSERYFYDPDAIREPYLEDTHKRAAYGWSSTGSRIQGHQPGVDKREDPDYDKLNVIGRNKRTVWTVPTAPFPEAHFATFPEKLIEPCILAGTSERGVCAKCGAPWTRVVDRSSVNRSNAAAAGTVIVGKGHPTNQVREGHDVRNGPTSISRTLCWNPSCKCGTERTEPAIVLDPFMGAGTTALVALKAGRHFVGVELNPEYADLARRRIEPELAQGRLA